MKVKYHSISKSYNNFKKIAVNKEMKKILKAINPNKEIDLSYNDILTLQKYQVYDGEIRTGVIAIKTTKGYIRKTTWTINDCLYAYKQKYGKNSEKQVIIQESELIPDNPILK